jgi:hypothetical protein
MQYFNYKGALDINRARIDHLNSLDLNFTNKTVLETGCGGRGDITRYLLSRNALLTLNDYRQENINSILTSLNTTLDSNTWDLNQPIPTDKKFDIIVSYGTLYHLNKPEEAIINLSNICNEFLVLSTCTSGKNDESINVVKEDIGMNNQAGDGFGCRPGRLFLFNTLRRNFAHVYSIKTQPNHPEFPLHFPTDHTVLNSRNVFIGSHIKLENELLVEELLNDYTRC